MCCPNLFLEGLCASGETLQEDSWTQMSAGPGLRHAPFAFPILSVHFTVTHHSREYDHALSPLGPLAAAAAAKSLQSCPTLCDPIDGSPPGSPVPGILQARTLEWVWVLLGTPKPRVDPRHNDQIAKTEISELKYNKRSKKGEGTT